MDVKEWAKLQESLLKSQLTTIREFLRRGEEPTFKPRKNARSQMSIIYDILHSSSAPLHVSEILARAKDEFNVDLDRESVVSAMIKKVKRGRMFKRVGPNTFAILDSPSGEKTDITNPQ
jgi:predicted transcriptional regulator